MKHTSLFILTLLFLGSAFSQHSKQLQQDDWITEVATVEFEQGKIYFIYPQSQEYNQKTLPPFLITGAYSIKMDYTRTYSVQKKMSQMILDLDKFVEGFTIEHKDTYDKKLFIRAATLELIWSSYRMDLFTDNSYEKLSILSKDKESESANMAKQASGLYDTFLEAGVTRLKRIGTNSTSSYLDVLYDGDKLIFDLNISEDKSAINIRIKDIYGHEKDSMEFMQHKEKIERKAEGLIEGIYIASLFVNGKEMESIKFTIL